MPKLYRVRLQEKPDPTSARLVRKAQVVLKNLDSNVIIEEDDCPADEISEEALEAITRSATEATRQPSQTPESGVPSDSDKGEKTKRNL